MEQSKEGISPDPSRGVLAPAELCSRRAPPVLRCSQAIMPPVQPGCPGEDRARAGCPPCSMVPPWWGVGGGSYLERGESPPQAHTPPSSAGSLGSKLEATGTAVLGLEDAQGVPVAASQGLEGQNEPWASPQSSPNRGGGCLGVKGKSQVWVTPECSAPPCPPRELEALRGYVLMCTEAAAAPGGGFAFQWGFICVSKDGYKKGGKPNSNSQTVLPVTWGGLGWGGTTRSAPRPPNCMRVKRPGCSFPPPSLCPKHQLELQLGGFKSINKEVKKKKDKKTPQSVPPLSLFLCGAGAGWGGQGASGPTAPQRPRRKERTKPHLAACTLLWFS